MVSAWQRAGACLRRRRMSQAVYRFADFELNWETRVLSREGEPVALEPKVLEFIHYLLENRERAVGKDELAEKLWPGRFISDSVITQTVRKARHAVDDDGERQAVIGTVRGFGYRFTAEIEGSGGEAATSSPSRIPARAIALGAAGVFLLAVLLILVDPHPASAPIPLSVAIAPAQVEAGNAEGETWLYGGIGALIRYALAGLPNIIFFDVAGESAEDEARDETWLSNVLGAREVIQPRAVRTDSGWLIELAITTADDDAEVFHAEAGTPAEALLPLIRRLQSRYGHGQPSRIPFLFEDAWLNEALARTIHALEAGDPALAQSTATTILDYHPGHAWTRYFEISARRQLGEHEVALNELRLLIEEIDEVTEPALAWNIHNSIGVALHFTGDPETARQHFSQAAQLAEGSGNLRDYAQALVSRGAMEAQLDNDDTASRLYAEAMTAFSRIGYLPGRALVANSLGVRAWRAGDLEGSAGWHNEALELRRRAGRRSEVAQSLLNLSTVAHAQLDFEQGRQLIGEALLITETHGTAAMHAWATVQLGHNQMHRGRLSRAAVSLENGLLLAEDIDYRQARAGALGGLGRLAVHRSSPDQARVFLLNALATFQDMSHTRTRILDAWLDLAEVELLADNTQAAADWLEQARVDMDEHGYPDAQGSIWHRLNARLLLSLGNHHEAERELRRSMELAMRVNNLLTRTETASALAKLLIEQHRDTEADALLDELPEAAAGHWRTLTVRAELAINAGDLDHARSLKRSAREQAGEYWNIEQRERLAEIRTGGT